MAYIYINNIIQKQNMFLKAFFSFMFGFAVLSMEEKKTKQNTVLINIPQIFPGTY